MTCIPRQSCRGGSSTAGEIKLLITNFILSVNYVKVKILCTKSAQQCTQHRQVPLLPTTDRWYKCKCLTVGSWVVMLFNNGCDALHFPPLLEFDCIEKGPCWMLQRRNIHKGWHTMVIWRRKQLEVSQKSEVIECQCFRECVFMPNF